MGTSTSTESPLYIKYLFQIFFFTWSSHSPRSFTIVFLVWLPLVFITLRISPADSLEESLKLEKIEVRKRRGRQRRDGWMASLMQWTWSGANFGRWGRSARPGGLKSGTWLCVWTITTRSPVPRPLNFFPTQCLLENELVNKVNK